jgi:hypothetical protein
LKINSNVTNRNYKVLKKWRIKAKNFKFIHNKIYKNINNHNFNPLYLHKKQYNKNKMLILKCKNYNKILIVEIKIIKNNNIKEL